MNKQFYSDKIFSPSDIDYVLSQLPEYDVSKNVKKGFEYIDEYCDGTTERGKAFRKAICEKMHFDSLEYQTLEGMMKAIGVEPCKVCTYCWNGKE
jgi:hypothetical protein